MKKLIGASAIAIAASTALAASAGAQTLIFCSEGSPENFSPALSTAGTTFTASSTPIYNRLAQFERGTTQVIPGLAESWDVSDDGLTYTFNLRQGVPFHTTSYFTPTRDFNADDVMFSVERQLDVDHPFHDVSGGTYTYFNGMGMGDLSASVDRVDDHTVRFNLTQPVSPFLSNLAMDFASIYSAEYAEQMMDAGTPEQVDLQPIGTGPWVLQNYQRDAVIRYTRNDEYWDGPAGVENLIYAITPDPQVRYQKLLAGECHIMAYPNPADLGQMEENPDVNVLSQEGLNVGYLAFNTEREPFDNRDVRLALAMAVDRQAILDAVFQGSGDIAVNPIPPTMWSWNGEIEDYSYDPDAARAMLAEAGYPDGFSTNIWAMPVQRPYNPNARRMAELIQEDWAQIGVEAEIVSYEWGEYLQRSRDGEHDTVLLGWNGDNGDPDNFLNDLLGCDAAEVGNNRARWCYEPCESLIQEERTISDQDERTDLYEQAQVVFKEEAPWLTVAHSVVFVPMRSEVEGYIIDPLGSFGFYEVTLAE